MYVCMYIHIYTNFKGFSPTEPLSRLYRLALSVRHVPPTRLRRSVADRTAGPSGGEGRRERGIEEEREGQGDREKESA